VTANGCGGCGAKISVIRYKNARMLECLMKIKNKELISGSDQFLTDISKALISAMSAGGPLDHPELPDII